MISSHLAYPSIPAERHLRAEIRKAEENLSVNDIYAWLENLDGVSASPLSTPVTNTTMRTPFSEEHEVATRVYDSLLQRSEMTSTSLDILWSVLAVMPTNYTAWVYRRTVFRSLLHASRSALECSRITRKELVDSGALALRYSKNFQVWNHRNSVVSSYCSHVSETFGGGEVPLDERLLCDLALSADCKNYHTWSYRKWFVQRLNLLEGESGVTEMQLKNDSFNNSAWCHRYFAIHNDPNFSPVLAESEKNFAHSFLKRNRCNQAAQGYLSAMENAFESPDKSV
ncbi:prenyltransferase alpha subunit [Perkinsela sp. CCAP 1560/4]|nr:Protein prenyltransferase alpha subunit [Perkinsela sp. CCAP 1560/4]KNH03921.1 prenyltransferase alpha subunit [Perkinsela sp. CCAP 1560/4]|eukprot:KNH01805.1 Protein prenyltransferase alpha subunit [Perkinsela sp. CCAP 1560/4]